jgi:sugar lactone lactonase YvrE
MPPLIAGLIDVFTDEPLEGNPLAVLQAADELSEKQMRRLTDEFNQAETTFILRSTRADRKLRPFVSLALLLTASIGVTGCSQTDFVKCTGTPPPQAGETLGIFAIHPGPLQQAIDAEGNVWIASYVDSTVIAMNSAGTVLHTYRTPYPADSVTIDAARDLWLTNQDDNSVTKISASGAVIGTFPVGKGPDAGAVDTRGHVWITNSRASSVTLLDSTGRLIGTYSTGSGSPWNVVIDAEGNAWTDNWTSGTVSKIGPNGKLLGIYPVGKNPQVLAVDAAGNVWVPNQGDDTVTKLAKDGRQIFTTRVPVHTPGGLAIDGGGNVWVYGTDTSEIVALDSAGCLLGTFSIGNHSAFATVDGAGAIWITSFADGTIHKLSTGSAGVVTPAIAALAHTALGTHSSLKQPRPNEPKHSSSN